MTGWDEAQRSITNSNVCGDLGMWYELRTLLGFGFVCVPAYVWRGIFMGVCACESQTDRWTDRNSQKMKVRYWGYAGKAREDGRGQVSECEWKASETDKQFNSGFTKTITSWSSYFNILSVPCCVCVKLIMWVEINGSSSSFILYVFFSITQTITLY